jgi:hypothetical protein
MPSVVSRAARVAGRVAPYAVVPFALSLLAVRKVSSAATGAGGLAFGVKFALPADVPTLWTLVDPPAQGVAVSTPVPLVAVPVFLAAEAAVVAGFLGVVRDAYRGDRPDFAAAASDHWVSVLGVRVVQFVVFVGLGAVLVGGGLFGVVVGTPLFVLLGYLLWGAPYLVVLRDSDALTAVAGSAELASVGDRYLWFSVGYALAAAAASLPASLLVSAGGLPGVVVGAAAVAYPALVASAAAAIVVDETADRVASRRA